MSDCFIRPLTVMEKNNEPDAKDAVLNEGIIQLLRFLPSERKKNDESNCLHNEHRQHREICKDAWTSDRFAGLFSGGCKKNLEKGTGIIYLGWIMASSIKGYKEADKCFCIRMKSYIEF